MRPRECGNPGYDRSRYPDGSPTRPIRVIHKIFSVTSAHITVASGFTCTPLYAPTP
jgi:hypothetical protein